MSPSDLSTVSDSISDPGNLVEAGVYPTAGDGFERGLAVLAVGHPFWLVPGGAGYRLLVEPAAFEAVRIELAEFERERVGWPPPPVVAYSRPVRRADVAAALLWALAVLAAYWAQSQSAAVTARGALDARAVFGAGEIWRAGTALFLHADVGHLVSNLLSGLVVFSLVLARLGRVRGAWVLGLASVAANFGVAAAYYPSDYRSIGASTAVFAGLGLLTGLAVTEVVRAANHRSWRAVVVPLAAGLTVLGLFGAGGVRVDVLAHLAGFAAGCAAAVIGGGWLRRDGAAARAAIPPGPR
jgi:rhomboid protease GluP